MVSVTERVPAPDLGRVPLALTGLLAAAGLLVVVAALLPSAWLVLAGAVVVAGLEAATLARARFLRWTLDRITAGAPVRALVQGVALLVLLVRSDTPAAWTTWAAVAVLAMHLVCLGGTGLAELSRRQRKMPLVTRGLPLALAPIPAGPPPWLAGQAADVLSWPVFLLVAGGSLAVLSGGPAALVAGTVLALGAGAAGTAVLARAVWAMRGISRRRFQAAVKAALAKLEPTVALYFAGGPESAYQLQMWIEPIEKLGRPVLVILRDREMFRTLGPTRLPVLCVEPGNVLMGLDLPALRLALYPAHAQGNLHLLRRRAVVHAFIGHGDSDKPVTSNPFLKAYDEIWVSGPAARERLLAARIGVDEARIREIGRPQLDDLAVAFDPDPRPGAARVTVLYTPTWEGYDDAPFQTSVGPVGLAVLRCLLEEPDIRVLYRPHPLLGTRDPAVRRAHREILTLLGNPAAAKPVEWPDQDAGARDDLELAGVHNQGESRTEHVAAAAVWARRQLAAASPAAAQAGPLTAERAGQTPGTVPHLLVPGPQFPLSECMAAATVLLCDVSSVITEFLVTGKAYGVTNPAGLSGDEFAVRYPSTLGGYLIGPDGQGLAGLLAAARGTADPAADRRAELRQALLGPSDPPAVERMRQAVADAVAEAIAR